ncbi:urease accessory protein UreD [uncultured Roseobacter sp.]|uniref:urease accessory protein UreD n=1 Tax=uncultured Roseobacter sp. TaxID=114847 RepID=UPI0026097760|nr:urease accessory protein UreD [uncultured Roseobacter sp.]
MTHVMPVSRETGATPRSVGSLRLSTKRVQERSGLARFRTSGSIKVAFPRRDDAVEAIILNTSGGLTGGDRVDLMAEAGAGSHLILTTQAAERAYRSRSGHARVGTRLAAAAGSTLHWLPQETIVFDGASIERRLHVDLATNAELVLVEPIVFGRRAMGETLTSGTFRDSITINRDNEPIYLDRIDLTGDIGTQLARPAVCAGMTSLASALYCGPRAQGLLPAVRQALPATGGASLLAPDLLSIRCLASDSFLLRRSLVPVLEMLTDNPLPKSWSL